MSKTVPNRNSAKKMRCAINAQLLDGRFHLSSAKAPVRTLMSLNELRQSGELCDAKLKVGGKLINVHRGILAVNSDFFRAMFSVDMQENQSGIISLENITNEEVLEKMINYLYTGKIEVSLDEIQDLLFISDMLQMVEVKDACAQQMLQNLCTSNCIGMLKLSRQLLLTDITHNALAYIKGRFPSVCTGEEFLELEIQELCEILSYPDLALGNRKEDEVVYAVLRWLNHQHDSRKAEVHQTVPCIRWKYVRSTCLQHLKSHQSLEDCPEFWESFERCKDVGCEARSPPRSVCVMAGYLQSRTGPKCPQLVTVYRMNPICENPEWLEMAPIDHITPFSLAFNLDGKLLCFLFSNEQENSNDKMHSVEVFEYNSTQDTWEDISYALSCDHKAALLDCFMQRGTLFYDESTGIIHGLSSLKHFSIAVKDSEGDVMFDKIAYLAENEDFVENVRGDHSLATVKGCLYAIGGMDVHSITEQESSAEMYSYNRESDCWVKRASMNTGRSRSASVNINGFIYVIGGYATVRLKTMERYDPVSDQWTALSSMERPRTHHAAVCIAGKIIVMGGKSYAYQNGGARKVQKSCELYDPDTDQWCPLPNMPQARCMFSAVVI